MPRRRAAVSVAVAFVLAVVVAGALSLMLVPAPAANARLLCGVERWSVKTLADQPGLLPLRETTIAYLVGRHAPGELPATRLPFERHRFWLLAAVTLVRSEQDGDLHLVLSDGSETMIAESPAPACTAGATTGLRREMAQARTQVRLCARARVSGVAFFDFAHGQTGVAPNAIELHPVLGFRCLSTAPAATAARGHLRLLAITSPIHGGAYASLTVAVSRPSSCSITVNYKSGPSQAAGLYPKRSSGGRVSWTWKVGTRTTPGRWPITVSCGTTGTLHTSFVVR